MKILIAEDDATSQLLLQSTLEQWDHEVVVTSDGLQAYQALLADDAPRLAIFDWMMPHLDGVDICRKAREEARLEHLYVIMLTTRDTKDDIAEALSAGADDYLNKPFDRKELQARIQVGKRVLDSQMTLSDRVRELEESLAREKHLQGLLPICSYCKKSATTSITGSRSSAISKLTLTSPLATASAPTATIPGSNPRSKPSGPGSKPTRTSPLGVSPCPAPNAV